MADETDIPKFLWRIVHSISFALMWLMVNVFLGLYLGLGVVNGKISLGNILFYCWFVISFAALLRYFYLKWKNHL